MHVRVCVGGGWGETQGVFFPSAHLYSYQHSFIKIIHLSSAVYVCVCACACVCVCVCGSSSVGGLACLLLRCYNLPGSGGTIISVSFLPPPPPPHPPVVHSVSQSLLPHEGLHIKMVFLCA